MSFEHFMLGQERGFIAHNYYDTMPKLRHDFYRNKYCLEEYKDCFFFYEKEGSFMHYFINEYHKFKLRASYVRLIFRQEQFLKHQKFLEKNDFYILSTYTQMILKNSNFNPSSRSILRVKREDTKQIYDFLSSFFDPYLLSFESLTKKSILAIKYEGDIKAALVYDRSLWDAYIEYMAIDESMRGKDMAKTLLEDFFAQNQGAYFFKLFVCDSNYKAIHFYKKSGFSFSDLRLNFYRNF